MTATLEQVIRATLQGQLITAPGIPAAAQRAWENLQFTPSTGVPWIDSELSYLQGVGSFRAGPVGLGQTSPIRHCGLFVVQYYGSNGVSPVDIEGVVTSIRQTFKASFPLPYTVGSYNGELQIIRTTRRQGLTMDTWYMIPVIVEWRTDAPYDQ